MVIEYWLSNNAGGSVTANGIAGKVTIRQLAIFKNYIKCHSIWFLGWLKINCSSDCPIYYGKMFPNIMRIYSHKIRESFPY